MPPKTSISRLAAVIASVIPNRPVRLARAVTYVGGDVPGGQPAVGVWAGGQERATVVHLPPGDAQKFATALAVRNKQKTAVWFTPGAGNDALHIAQIGASPDVIRSSLNRHGLSYATIIPGQRGAAVHIIDQGGELTGAVRAFAAEHGAKLHTLPGSAGYAETGAVKLNRPFAAVLNPALIPNTGRRTVRLVDHGRVLVRAAASALSRADHTGVSAAHGGGVNNSYGYNAITDTSMAAASLHPEEGTIRASLWTGTVPANKVTLGGAAANAYGAEARPLYDDRYGSVAKDAARQAVLNQHRANMDRGAHTLEVQIPQNLLHHFLLMKDEPGVFADWAEENGHLNTEEARPFREATDAHTAALALIRRAMKPTTQARPLPRVQMARTPEMIAHQTGAEANADDATGWETLADHHDENGEPGGVFLREHAKHIRANHPLLGSHAGKMRSIRDRTLGSLYSEYLGPDSSLGVFVRGVRATPLPGSIMSVLGHADDYFPRVVAMKKFGAFPIHVSATPENVEALAKDMGETHGDVLRRAVKTAYLDV